IGRVAPASRRTHSTTRDCDRVVGHRYCVCRTTTTTQRGLPMPKYRVTLRYTSVEIVEADNPYQAAVVASARNGDDVEIANVTSAGGGPARASQRVGKATKKSVKKVKKVAKKRRRLSPEARAKL